MITHTEEIKEYEKDGSLRYECTMAFLDPRTEHLYRERTLGKNGSFIRIKHATKYRVDGSIEWRLIYNDMGVVIGSHRGSTVTDKTFK